MRAMAEKVRPLVIDMTRRESRHDHEPPARGVLTLPV
jgi:hypothetical protein